MAEGEAEVMTATLEREKDQFVPQWMDMPTLARHVCAHPDTIRNWVAERGFPKPSKPGGRKLMWEWSAVERWLKNDRTEDKRSHDADVEAIRNAARTIASEPRRRRDV